MVKNQKSKRPVAHKRAIRLLKQSSLHLPTVLALYSSGTIVPSEDILKLCEAFEDALDRIEEIVERVVKDLKVQLEESAKVKAT